MRVLGGTACGMGLTGGGGRGVRPFLAQVKKSLFDILGDIEGAKVLDLFAGTGGLGVEALSRGAAICVFVEKNRRMVEFIRRNLEKAGLSRKARIFQRDALRSSSLLSGLGVRYDLVFVDPPYRFFRSENQAAKLAREMDGLVARGLLSEVASVVVHHEAGEENVFLGGLERLSVTDMRKYGQSGLTFLSIEENEEV